MDRMFSTLFCVVCINYRNGFQPLAARIFAGYLLNKICTGKPQLILVIYHHLVDYQLEVDKSKIN